MSEALNETELRDLAERVQQIAEMAETLAWDLFSDRAYEQIRHHQERVLSGSLDERDYHVETGWIKGALAILGLPQQVRDEFEREREAYREASEADDERAA